MPGVKCHVVCHVLDVWCQVKEKLPNFVMHDKGGGIMLYGIEAIKAVLRELLAKDAKDEPISLSSIEPLQLFSYVLDADDKQKTDDLLTKVLASTASFKSAATSSSSGAGAADNKKRKLLKDDAASGLFD